MTTSKTLVLPTGVWALTAILLFSSAVSPRLVRAENESFSATHDRAVNLYRTGKRDEAISLYRQLVSLEPKNTDVLRDLMWALWHADRYEEAGSIAAELLKLKSDDTEAQEIASKSKPFAMRALAVAAYRAGKFEEAAELYRRLAKSDPNNASIQKDLMWSEWGAGHYLEAGQIAAHLTNLNPRDPEAWNMLARTQLTSGQTELSLESYKRSLTLDPKQSHVKQAIGKLYVDLREFRTAMKLFDEVRRNSTETPQLYPQLAKAEFYEGLYTESARDWAKSLEFFPDNLNYRVHEAQALYYSGQIEPALKRLKKIADETHHWPAIDFMVDDALANGDAATASEILESNLTELRPQDEPRLLRLAGIYQDHHQPKRCLTVLNRYLAINPKSAPATLFKADFLTDQGDVRAAAAEYERVLLLNPYCIQAFTGLAEAEMTLGHPTAALQAIRQARTLDPTNPYFIALEGRYLYDSGDRKTAQQMVSGWVKKNKGPVVPVLLYHGLTPFRRDPILAYSVHTTITSFDAQMHAVKDAGYSPITARELAAWYQGKGKLPNKPILITFDDARIDSFRYGDPVLQKYGLKATMFAAIVNVEGSLPPAFSPWGHMQEYEKTGRWEIQSHGDLAHIHIPIDPDGRKGLFLVNRQWLAVQQRYETLAEWKDRIAADHDSSIRKVQEHLGHDSPAYALPEGTYGQIDTVNSPEAAPINLALLKKYFTVVFHQDRYGLNVRSSDPIMLNRIEPSKDWSGPELVRRLEDQNPSVVLYRMLIRQAAWSGRTHEAYRWLKELKNEGAAEPILLAEEGRVRSYTGDLSRAEELAQKALGLQKDVETQNIGTSIRDRMRPEWTPMVTYVNDNRQRENYAFRQSLELWTANALRLNLYQGFAHYHESNTPNVNDVSLGAGVARNFAIFHSASFQIIQHVLSGQAKDDVSFFGAVNSNWTDDFSTELVAGRALYDTASALNANISERYASIASVIGGEGSLWRLKPELRAASLSDGNGRATFSAELSRYFGSSLDTRIIYRFLYDHMHDIRPDYYSPQHLQQHQIGLEYAPRFRDVAPFVRFLPGWGRETNVSSGFITDLELGAPIKFGQNTSFGPYFNYVKTPTYRRNSYTAVFTHRF